MIIFLKSLTFILWNILLGTMILVKLNWFLFNRKPRRFLGLRIPLTPGLVVRKRDWIFNKARDILHDYLEQAENALNKHGYLAKWEKLVRDAVWEKTAFIDDWKFVPRGLKNKIHEALASAARDIASRVLRKLVPHLIEQWRVEHRIDEFDEQFSIEFIYKYYCKYVYKPLLLGFLALNFLIGLMNMVWFLIIV
jgi:uncharacterized membrane protein YheB (UPF0754 family)